MEPGGLHSHPTLIIVQISSFMAGSSPQFVNMSLFLYCLLLWSISLLCSRWVFFLVFFPFFLLPPPLAYCSFKLIAVSEKLYYRRALCLRPFLPKYCVYQDYLSQKMHRTQKLSFTLWLIVFQEFTVSGIRQRLLCFRAHLSMGREGYLQCPGGYRSWDSE